MTNTTGFCIYIFCKQSSHVFFTQFTRFLCFFLLLSLNNTCQPSPCSPLSRLFEASASISLHMHIHLPFYTDLYFPPSSTYLVHHCLVHLLMLIYSVTYIVYYFVRELFPTAISCSVYISNTLSSFLFLNGTPIVKLKY